jgi:DMSO reductase family type II enzyme heme b subunit
MVKVRTLCVGWLVAASIGCGGSEKPTAPVGETLQAEGPTAAPIAGVVTAEATAALLARGETLFANQCSVCHGVAGDGEGPYTHLLDPRPRAFTSDPFKIASTDNQIPTAADLRRTISEGMAGSAMPSWEHLPGRDLDALTAYVRKVFVDGVRARLESNVAAGHLPADEFDSELAYFTNPGEPISIPAQTALDAARLAHGRELYVQGCADCHGIDGRPVPEAVKTDDKGFPVMPRSFVAGLFKGGAEPERLFTRVLKGMKGTPMPEYEGVYSGQDIWDIVRYVQTFGESGAQERARLRQLRIAAKRVDAAPKNPGDPAWGSAAPTTVALAPLWWSERRIERLTVQALHDGEEIAFRLEWADATDNSRAVAQHEFRDGVAIQFSKTPDPPFFMGGPGQHDDVNIAFWKADRQRDIAAGHQDVDALFPQRAVDLYPEQNHVTPRDRQEADWPKGAIGEHRPEFITAWGAGNLVADPQLRSPVENLTAQGPGTLEGFPIAMQFVEGWGERGDGGWAVVIRRPMATRGEGDGPAPVGLPAGATVPVGFAVFDGAAGDREGKKNISVWQLLTIE